MLQKGEKTPPPLSFVDYAHRSVPAARIWDLKHAGLKTALFLEMHLMPAATTSPAVVKSSQTSL